MPDSGRPMFGLSVLKSDPGPVGLASVEAEMAKLELIRDLALPQGLWGGGGISPQVLAPYRGRVGAESAQDLRRHAPRVR
jgi:hypothetical protein